MSRVVVISGSPSQDSRTQALANHVGLALEARGFDVEAVNVRDLPASELLTAQPESEALRAALGLVQGARGVVICTPVYKASYTGVLKAFLDLLPQFGLGGKVVLPLATGGTLAHVLAIDYALRPVLSTLAAQHVVGGLFLLDKLVARQPDGGLAVDPELATRLEGVVGEFALSLARHHPPTAQA